MATPWSCVVNSLGGSPCPWGIHRACEMLPWLEAQKTWTTVWEAAARYQIYSDGLWPLSPRMTKIHSLLIGWGFIFWISNFHSGYFVEVSQKREECRRRARSVLKRSTQPWKIATPQGAFRRNPAVDNNIVNNLNFHTCCSFSRKTCSPVCQRFAIKCLSLTRCFLEIIRNTCANDWMALSFEVLRGTLRNDYIYIYIYIYIFIY